MAAGNGAGALAGIRIIDLSRVLGGPFCTQLLADHGADVVKVEPPTGDETREWGPPFSNEGLSAYYSGINRNKRDIALDIGRPEGREVLLRLLETADVMIENFKPGTLEKWGLGYEETLAKRFPRLIHARITGFGSDGPLGGFPGYDAMVQAWAGMMSVNGQIDSGMTRIGVPLVDIGTGLNTAVGILMAVIERGRSGKGQFLEVTLYDAALTFQHPHAPNYFMNGVPPKLTGNSHSTVAPYQVKQTRTCQVLIGAGNDRQFRTLMKVLGRPEVAEDARFRSNQDRVANLPALTDILTECVAEEDGLELAMRLMRAGVACGPLLQVPDVFQHPHTQHRQMIAELDGYRGVGMPIKLKRTPGSVRRRPPLFNQHGPEVLREAGYSEAEIESLRQAGIMLDARQKLGA